MTQLEKYKAVRRTIAGAIDQIVSRLREGDQWQPTCLEKAKAAGLEQEWKVAVRLVREGDYEEGLTNDNDLNMVYDKLVDLTTAVSWRS